MFWRKDRQLQAQERAAQVYVRRDKMLEEIVPLADAGATVEDLMVCLGCGHLVLRGSWPGWKDLHIAGHAWHMATNPYAYPDWHRALSKNLESTLDSVEQECNSSQQQGARR